MSDPPVPCMPCPVSPHPRQVAEPYRQVFPPLYSGQPLTNVSYTVNYDLPQHADGHDAEISLNVWMLVGAGCLTAGEFELSLLGIFFRPLQGSMLAMNTKLLWHGTNAVVAGGTAERWGSALWVNPGTVADVLTCAEGGYQRAGELVRAGEMTKAELWKKAKEARKKGLAILGEGKPMLPSTDKVHGYKCL